MAKKQSTQEPSADAATQQGKQEKKLAKREAKAMLAVDEARNRLAAAEKKLARAQLRLEVRRTRLQAAEAHLAELRNSRQTTGTPGKTDGVEAYEETDIMSSDDGAIEESSSFAEEQAGEPTTASPDAGGSQADVGADEHATEAASESDIRGGEEFQPEEALPGEDTYVEAGTDAAAETGEAIDEGSSETASAAAGSPEEADTADAESEQTQQVPWWKRAPYSHSQHDG